MATVNLGRIKPVFRGAYNNSTAYVIDDIVTSGGETFIAIAATTGNATSDASKWTKLAAKGTDGSSGDSFSLANKEIAFKTNAGALDGIPIGTAGQALKVNSGATGYEFGSAGGVNTPMFRAHNSSNTLGSGSAGTYYKIPMHSEDYDVGGCYNNTSGTVTLNGISTPSYSFAPNVAGKYMIGASIRLSGNPINSGFMAIRIEKNGNNSFYNGFDQDAGYYSMVQVHGVVEMNGTSDYVSAHYSVRDNWYEVYNAHNATYFYGYKLIE